MTDRNASFFLFILEPRVVFPFFLSSIVPRKKLTERGDGHFRFRFISLEREVRTGNRLRANEPLSSLGILSHRDVDIISSGNRNKGQR